MIAYEKLINMLTAPRSYAWTDRDVMLYALGVGFGQDPMDLTELPFVYEADLRVVPSFATVAAWEANPPANEMGIDYTLVVQSEQGITLHKPLPNAANVLASGRVTGAVDKGPKGAIIFREIQLTDESSGDLIATITSSIFARGDGGFGGPDTKLPPPPMPPDRAPDKTLTFTTRADQALLYRLSGDRNPLHADPAAARIAGFDRPVLHGLCTYGITCRAVLAAFADYRPERIFSHHARFSSPVFPGETIDVDLWRDGKEISFEARVRQRDIVVIKNGRSVFR